MQIKDRPITISNPTLSTLIAELGEECANVQAFIDQLKLPHLSYTQQAEILAELLAVAIHLHTHCGEDFQILIADEMEKLPDDESD